MPSSRKGLDSDPRPARRVRMNEATFRHRGRNLRYAVSDNVPGGTVPGSTVPGGTVPGSTVPGGTVPGGTAPGGTVPGRSATWAINIHGFFAGGGMYWRESTSLATRLGWRVVNPCVPGFADSDPLPGARLSVASIAEEMNALLDHLSVEEVVLIGHSMGAAIAVDMAEQRPDRALGIIYRAGVATPAWRKRRGPVARLLSVVSPDVAGVIDILAAAALDMPDLLVGRRPSSTFRRLLPDARMNVRAMGDAMAVGTMLMSVDSSGTVRSVCEAGIPLLPVWGCFDRITNAATAAELASVTGEKVVWVPGGHSWMLPRPQGQADILLYVDRGKRFLEAVEERRDLLSSARLDIHGRGRTLQAG